MKTSFRLESKYKKIILFILYLMLKVCFDFSFNKLVAMDVDTYHPEFKLIKYVVGIFFCIVLYIPILVMESKASSFFLAMILCLQFLPISTIYAFCNGSSLFYVELCLSFLVCELICLYRPENNGQVERNDLLSFIMMAAFLVIIVLIILFMIKTYGKPSFKAMDIYSVYEIRSSGPDINKYVGYALGSTMYVFFPVLLSWSIKKRRFVVCLLSALAILLIYLYTGNKSYLFSIPLVVACTLFLSKRENPDLLLGIMLFSFVCLILIASFTEIRLFSNIYSLFVRRCCFVPALNKFSYYEYFSTHPKLGIAGIFPTWIVPYEGNYTSVSYPLEISAIYYGKPEMYSNTGFLVEGFARFGHFGMLFEMVLFSLVLKLIDSFQKRTDCQTTIGWFVFVIYLSCDAFFLDSLFFGPWMFAILILLLYKNNRIQISLGNYL